MHPEIMQDQPGKCPICGMDLVPAGNAAHDAALHVDAASVEKLGVKLARAQQAKISQDVGTYGNVAFDENTQFNVQTKYDGWIRRIHVHSVGEKIEKGQVLYEIYSPDLIMRQKQYLKYIERKNQLLKTVGDTANQENEFVMDLLQEFAKERQRFLYEDIGVDTISQIEDSHQPLEVVKILAPQSGVVTQINVREGSFVNSSSPLFKMADISTVWIDVPLYPDQVGRVKTGDSATIQLSSGEKIIGKINFISPLADSNKVLARISIDNHKYHLRPGAFVDIAIHARPHEALVLPRSAVMHTGLGNRVMLFLGSGHFLPVPVETGIENADEIEILDGLQNGAQVAVNGQFLLDAAASLQDATTRMQSEKPHAQ